MCSILIIYNRRMRIRFVHWVLHLGHRDLLRDVLSVHRRLLGVCIICTPFLLIMTISTGSVCRFVPIIKVAIVDAL